MSEDHVQVKKEEHVTIVTLNRPPANAMDVEFCQELDARLGEIETDETTRVLVLTGSGNCFSAGLDLKQVPYYGRGKQQALVKILNQMFLRLFAFPIPTLAALNGHSVAGGMVLTLCCDYRIAVDRDCKCGLAEVRVGVAYPEGAIRVVLSQLSQPMARIMAQLGKSMPSTEAQRMGVLDEVVSSDALMERAMVVARELAEMPPLAYRRVKRQVRGDTIDHIQRVIDEKSDPALEAWMTAETADAAADVLSGRREI